MPEPRVRGRRAVSVAAVALLLVAALLAAPASAAPYPILPVGDGAILLGNLTAPTLAPGQSGAIAYTIVDPLPSALAAAVVTF